MNARKTLLVHDNRTWTKKNSNFDIAMGAYDGAEVTDLVGLYILNELKIVAPEIDFGLYRDDGLGTHNRMPATKLNQIIKKIKNMFRQMGLEITFEKNLTNVNFLDITFDLLEETYEPYRKPNDYPIYVNVGSNHPPAVIKNIPISINKRLTEISSSKELFDKHKKEYQNALDSSGYKHKLSYNKEKVDSKPRNKNKNRKRKIIWFNPPYHKNLKTNLGKEFLKLIDKNFPKDNVLNKIINRKTVKVSYSCSNNMRNIISAHNRKILNGKKEDEKLKCNCRGKCILPGNCRASCVVYKASTNDEIKKIQYIGSTSTEFKIRYRNHKTSFAHENNKNQTALSQYIWNNDLNKNEEGEITQPDIKWEILKECRIYQGGQKPCDLCTTEKLFIINSNVINHRSDLGGKCAHRNRFMLAGIT